MLWRQNNFGFARRMPVRWRAQSWRPEIVAATAPVFVWPAGQKSDRHSGRFCRVRRSADAFGRRTAPRARSGATFLHLPQLRINNSSPI